MDSSNISEIFLALFVFLIFAGVAIGLLVIYVKSRGLDPCEEGEEPIYQETAGGRFDDYNFTIPFVRVAIYDSNVVISYVRKLVFRKDEIIKSEIVRKGVSKGVQIHHYKYGFPERIIIWSGDVANLWDKLNQK